MPPMLQCLGLFLFVISKLTPLYFPSLKGEKKKRGKKNIDKILCMRSKRQVMKTFFLLVPVTCPLYTCSLCQVQSQLFFSLPIHTFLILCSLPVKRFCQFSHPWWHLAMNLGKNLEPQWLNNLVCRNTGLKVFPGSHKASHFHTLLSQSVQAWVMSLCTSLACHVSLPEVLSLTHSSAYTSQLVLHTALFAQWFVLPAHFHSKASASSSCHPCSNTDSNQH